MPAPSALSMACSPVSRSRTKSFGNSTWAIARPDLRLVVAHPHELGRRKAGQRVVAGDRDQPLRADGLADQVALRRRPLVVPQDRRSEHLVGVVEQDERRASGRSARQRRCPRRDAARGQNAAAWPRSRRPTTARVLLAPQRPRRLVAVLGGADPDDGARLVDEDGLRCGRRDVDPEDVGPSSAVSGPRPRFSG